MASESNIRQFVHELTLEYAKQGDLLKHSTDRIDEQISFLANVSKAIYESVSKNADSFKWL